MKKPDPQYWLMKSEPDVYSIDDLARDGRTPWTGVRNFQARNFMRDAMRVGDVVFFYHSNAEPPGIAGQAAPDTRPIRWLVGLPAGSGPEILTRLLAERGPVYATTHLELSAGDASVEETAGQALALLQHYLETKS